MEFGEMVIEERYYGRKRREETYRPLEGDKLGLGREDSWDEETSWDECASWMGAEGWDDDDFLQEEDLPEEEVCEECDDGGREERRAGADSDDPPESAGERNRDRKRGVRNRALGRRGEKAAVRYLERIGYEVLEQNWTCPAGEADIIAMDDEVLVFIEVKTRTDISKGFPAEAVDAAKRARYEKIAAWYLKDADVLDVPVRFDIVALLIVAKDRAFMRHYINAYGTGC